MILPDLLLPSRVNQRWTESGLDSYDKCLDKNHFLSYPHQITYEYNSRGFRDQEWPDTIDELKNSVWCIGDSFTVGLGSPVEHTWPYIVGKQLNRRVINVSMDGASNEWIARRATDIYNEVTPTNMIVMWSYFHRRESSDENLTDEQRRQYTNKLPDDIDATVASIIDATSDFDNFLDCVNKVSQLDVDCIHFFIPYEFQAQQLLSLWDEIKGVDWPDFPPVTIEEYNQLPDFIINEISSIHKSAERNLKQLFDATNLASSEQLKVMLNYHKKAVPRLDLARDGHHFDLLTSQWVADRVADTWQVGQTRETAYKW
jgi:hypothetical protein